MKEKLKQYMRNNTINQKQLASLMGTSESHLSKLLNDRKKAGASLIEKYHSLPGIQEKKDINIIINTMVSELNQGNLDIETFQRITKTIDNPGD